MTLQLAYRPQNFDEFYGNVGVIESLKQVMKRKPDDIPKSFLFTGLAGCGKTSAGRIVANALTKSLDIIEYNSSNTRGIDTIREIKESMQYVPVVGNKKVYILEECHQITGPAQEALLLLLEEPSAHVHFILCTTEPEKLKPTILRRCHHCQFSPLSIVEMEKLLNDICESEGVSPFPKELLNKIISISEGSPGRALSYLDSIIDVEDTKNALDILVGVSYEEKTTIELCRALMKQDWGICANILKTLKGDPESIRYGILGYFKSVLLNTGKEEIANIMMNFMDSYVNSGMAGLTLSVFLSCKK